jgi:hypothetical protein
MFCEARLSTDCALVKELLGGIAPPFGSTEAGVPASAQNCERKSRWHQQAATV